MRAKLDVHERQEVQIRLAEISNTANVMADQLDPKGQARAKDGERYQLARHFDAIYKLAKAARLKMESSE